MEYIKFRTEDIDDKIISDSYSIEKMKEYMPDESKMKIYLDFDAPFIVLYAVIEKKQETLYLDSFSFGPGEDHRFNVFLYLFKEYMESYGFRKSLYFNRLYTLPLRYTDDILDFLIEAVPELMNIADIYHTPDFKSVMIKRSIKFNINNSTNSLLDYLEISFDFDSEILPQEILEIMELLEKEEEQRFYQLRGRGFIDLRAEKVMETIKFLSKFGITSKELEQKKLIIPKCEIPFIANAISQAEQNDSFEITGLDINEIVNRMFSISDKQLIIPDALNAEMRPYQVEGYKWLKTLFHAGLGGILADDMGLGKTLQTITLILSAYVNDPSVKALIVVPTTLIDNWISELNRFAPDLKCRAIIGPTEVRKQILEYFDEYSVYITSYGLAVNDIEIYSRKNFNIMVLDEAQRIKNPLSKTAIEIKKFKAEVKFALTGTPIENNITDLWSIFNWLMPSLLKDHKSFNRRYIERSDKITELRDKTAPFILRRMRKDVLNDLPEKTETTIRVELTDSQKKLYIAYREKALELLLAEEKRILNILSILTRLRQICCHPGMFMEDYRESSSKLDTIMDIIEELRDEGRKVLVFSQFVQMLDIIKEELDKREIKYQRLDGRTPQYKRSIIVEEFNEGEATAFLISLKAGGTGLNLVSADTVIHCDPWWNPGAEEQATARAYRIGQKNNVHIISLITKGTIENKVNEVKQGKLELIEKLIQPGTEMLTGLSVEEIRDLLR